MNHGKSYRKLGRTPAHRRAVLRNLATSLVLHERIETTLPKAKELKRVADRLVTLGKKGSLSARRQAMEYLIPINRKEAGNTEKRSAVHKLFSELAPRFEERSGGYTRVLRGRKSPMGKALTGRRPGDNAQMAIIEFVEEKFDKKAPAKKKRRVTRRVEAETESADIVSADAEERVSAADDSSSDETA